jgi:hypothetical protein
LLILPPPSSAAQPVVSATMWRVAGQEVTLRFAFLRQAVPLLGDPGKPPPATEAVGRRVLAGAAVEQDGQRCPAIDLGYDLGRVDPLYLGPDLTGFEMLFRCPHERGSLVLREDALSALPAPHIGLASIRIGAAAQATRLIAGESRVLLPAGGPAAASTMAAYAWLGIQGLPGRLLHVAALCGLLLAVRRRGELVGLVSGVGAGYLAAALAAGAFDWVTSSAPEAAFDGGLVLLTAALLLGRASGELAKPALGLALLAAAAAGMALLRGHTGAALTLAGAGVSAFSLLSMPSLPGVCAARMGLAGLALGVVDGLALPSALGPLHTLVPLPLAGDLGYSVGAAATALGLLTFLTALTRWLPVRTRLLDAPLTAELAATVLAGVGAFEVLVV